MGTPVYSTFNLVEVFEPGVTLRGFTIDGADVDQPDHSSWKASANNLQAMNADDLRLEGLTLTNAWSNGLLALGSDRVEVIDVVFEGVRCAAVHIGNTENFVVDGSTFRRVGTHSSRCAHSEGAVTYSLDNFDVAVVDSCFQSMRNPDGAVARMNLQRNDGLLIENNTVCDGAHLFAARNPGVGNVWLIDNQVFLRDGLYDVPEAMTLDLLNNVAIDRCVCP